MATKAELEAQLAAVIDLDEETTAFAGVLKALEPLSPRWRQRSIVREQISRVLRHAGERFGVDLYAIVEEDE